jgi:hypothetical protein
LSFASGLTATLAAGPGTALFSAGPFAMGPTTLPVFAAPPGALLADDEDPVAVGVGAAPADFAGGLCTATGPLDFTAAGGAVDGDAAPAAADPLALALAAEGAAPLPFEPATAGALDPVGDGPLGGLGDGPLPLAGAVFPEAGRAASARGASLDAGTA